MGSGKVHRDPLIDKILLFINIFILTNSIFCPILWTVAEEDWLTRPRFQEEVLNAPIWSRLDFHPRKGCY